MPFSSGPNTINDSIVFNYDIGDTTNSYKGQPITNQFSALGTSGFGPAADNGVSFPVNGTGTFIRLGYGQTFGGYTIQPNDVVYKYDLGANGCHYHGFDTLIGGGTYATFTFDYLVANAANYPTDGFLASFEQALNYGIAVPNSLQNVWQTVTFTAGPAGRGNLRSLLYPGGCSGQRLASSGYILFRNPQVTYTPYTVPFTQGTRDTTQGLLDISGNNNTIDLANMTYGANNAISFDGTDDYINLATNIQAGYTSATYEFICRPSSLPGSGVRQLYIQENSTWIALYNPSGTPFFGIDLNNGSGWFDNNGGNNTGAKTTTPLSANTWYHVVFSWNGALVSAYLNGTLQSTTSTLQAANGRQNVTVLGPGTTARNIGSRSNGGGDNWVGNIPVVKFYNRALSTTEIQQNYLAYKSRFNLS
jgi:hypothetical protein